MRAGVGDTTRLGRLMGFEGRCMRQVHGVWERELEGELGGLVGFVLI